jgi:hypothetical protein
MIRTKFARSRSVHSPSQPVACHDLISSRFCAARKSASSSSISTRLAMYSSISSSVTGVIVVRGCWCRSPIARRAKLTSMGDGSSLSSSSPDDSSECNTSKIRRNAIPQSRDDLLRLIGSHPWVFPTPPRAVGADHCMVPTRAFSVIRLNDGIIFVVEIIFVEIIFVEHEDFTTVTTTGNSYRGGLSPCVCSLAWVHDRRQRRLC